MLGQLEEDKIISTLLYHNSRINFKWIRDLNVKKWYISTRRNHGQVSLQPGCREKLLTIIQNPENKIVEFDYIKMKKKFCMAQATVKEKDK